MPWWALAILLVVGAIAWFYTRTWTEREKRSARAREKRMEDAAKGPFLPNRPIEDETLPPVYQWDLGADVWDPWVRRN